MARQCSGKLNEISAKLDEVIDEIQKLRGYIDSRITAETVYLFRSQVDALRKQAEEKLAGITEGSPIGDDLKKRLGDLGDRITTPCCN